MTLVTPPTGPDFDVTDYEALAYYRREPGYVVHDGLSAPASPAPTVPTWAASISYAAGQVVQHPTSPDVFLRRIAAGVSRATFDATELATWKASGSASYVMRVQASGDATGATDDATIAAALSAALTPNTTRRHVTFEGDFILSQPASVKSFTTIDRRRATFTKVVSASVTLGVGVRADCRMLQNEHAFSGRFVNDGVMTLAGAATNYQSATAAFTSGDVGQTIRVWGAGAGGQTPAFIDATISALVDAQNVTLSTPALTAVTVAATYIGPRDTDIEIIGGYDSKPVLTAPQSNESWMYAHTHLWRHADNVRYTGITKMKTRGNKYAINFGEGDGFSIDRFLGDTAADGVHVTGPADNVDIGDVTGTFGDDAVALCTGEVAYGNGTGDTQGDIYDVKVSRVVRAGTQGNGLKLAGSSYGYRHRSITAGTVKNRNVTGAVGAVAIAGDTGAPLVDELRVEHATGANTISSGTHGEIAFGSMRDDTSSYALEVFNGATIAHLAHGKVRRAASAGDITAIYLHDAGTRVEVHTASDSHWPVGGNFLLVNTNATLGKALLSNVDYVPAAHTGCLVAAQATCTIDVIEASNCRSDGAFGFEILNGTTQVDIGGGQYYQTFHVGTAGVVNVFGGGWEQNQGGNQKDAGGVLRSWAPGWRTNVGDLTADSPGNSLINRDASKSCGVGPVAVVAANKWQHIVTGAVYAPAGTSTVAAQAGAGTGASASLTGTDGGGSITVTTGTGPAAGTQVIMTFLTTWGATPKSVIITPTNAAAQAAGLYVSAKSAIAFTVSAANAPTGNMTFDFMVRL